jgi:hypothetical protein
MGNGAKAASKRDRQKEAGPVAKSQLKSVRSLFPFLAETRDFSQKERIKIIAKAFCPHSHSNKTNTSYRQNLAAKSIKCKVCFQDFQSTAKRPALEEHASNKHSKKYEDCFPAAA